MSHTMIITQTDYGLHVEWGDGTDDAVYCGDWGDVVEDALLKAYKFGGKAIYAKAFAEGQRDAESRRDVYTRHDMGG